MVSSSSSLPQVWFWGEVEGGMEWKEMWGGDGELLVESRKYCPPYIPGGLLRADFSSVASTCYPHSPRWISVLKSHLWYKLAWSGQRGHWEAQRLSAPFPLSRVLWSRSCLYFLSAKGEVAEGELVAVVPWAVERTTLLRKEWKDNFYFTFSFLFWGQNVALNSDGGRA